MKKQRGIALMTALFVILILFCMASTLFYFGGRAAQSTSRTYEQTVTRYCGLAGLEYAFALLRRNVIVPPAKEDLVNHPEYMEVVINDLAFDDNGQKFITGVGVFRLSVTFQSWYNWVAPSTSGAGYFIIRSRGQIFRNLSDAQNNRLPLSQRTCYARWVYWSATRDDGMGDRRFYPDYIYEQWR